MEIASALREQYHAGLAMLAQCIQQCPDDLWRDPNPRNPVPANTADDAWNVHARSFWRIAFHAVFFTHLYLGQDEATFQAPSEGLVVKSREDLAALWVAPWAVEPYELPEATEPLTQEQLLEYLDFVDASIDPTVDGLDLYREDSGFSWYQNISKLSHQILNIRHLQGHVGQLSELLMLRGIDIRWRSRGA
ncbi:hypothetical protein EON81_20365 [bacterium]|nr:MAG: hypothetical protein EON81_20365 [bacterium]